MEHNELYRQYRNLKKDIPEVLKNMLIDLFPEELTKEQFELFNSSKTVDYSEKAVEYTIKYFPLNFYKICYDKLDDKF